MLLWCYTDSGKFLRVSEYVGSGIGILPMLHGLEAHATWSARINPNPYYLAVRAFCAHCRAAEARGKPTVVINSRIVW